GGWGKERRCANWGPARRQSRPLPPAGGAPTPPRPRDRGEAGPPLGGGEPPLRHRARVAGGHDDVGPQPANRRDQPRLVADPEAEDLPLVQAICPLVGDYRRVERRPPADRPAMVRREQRELAAPLPNVGLQRA